MYFDCFQSRTAHRKVMLTMSSPGTAWWSKGRRDVLAKIMLVKSYDAEV